MTESRQTDLAARLSLPAYPRSAAYDPMWQIATMMGPNALWLTESVTNRMRLEPGVLDLGCGMAASSIFLAREFGVQVWATDLWIAATDNLRRIDEAGVTDRVFPIHAEAHALPYADGFFDAIVSIDAYHYFGTSETYTQTLLRLLRPGGEFGMVAPGLVHELDTAPKDLAPFWEPDFWTWHSAAWWRSHLERTGPFEIAHAGDIPDAIPHWQHWAQTVTDVGYPPHYPSQDELPFLKAVNRSGAISIVEVVARKP